MSAPSSKLKSPPTIQLVLTGKDSAQPIQLVLSGKDPAQPKTPERKSFKDGGHYHTVNSSINRDSMVRMLTSPRETIVEPKLQTEPSPRTPYKTTYENLSYSHHYGASVAQTQTHNLSTPSEKAI